MELQLILINNQALCLYRSKPEATITTIKLHGEPVNEVDEPVDYLSAVCSRIGGLSLSQLSVSLTHDQVPKASLSAWGLALISSRSLDMRQLRSLFLKVSDHDQLIFTDEGVSSVSQQGHMSELIQFADFANALTPNSSLSLFEDASFVSKINTKLQGVLTDKIKALEMEKASLIQKASKPVRVPQGLVFMNYHVWVDFSIGYTTQLEPVFKNGSAVRFGSVIYHNSTASSPLDISVIEGIPEALVIALSTDGFKSNTSGYIYYLHEGKLFLDNGKIPSRFYSLTFAVVSSDPNDTIPKIKAWLMENNIPFYQG